MRISEREARVAASVQLRGPGSLADVARDTGFQPGTVRYAINRLRDSGMITPYPLIDISRLGYTEHLVFFTPARDSRKERGRLEKELTQSPQVSWFSRHYGGYDYMVVVAVRDVVEMAHFVDGLSARFKEVFFDKTTGTIISWSMFTRRYLWPKAVPALTGVTVARSERTVEIDDLDHMILRMLANRPFDSFRGVARLLGIAHSTLDYRLQNLREQGVFRGLIYSIDPQVIGVHAMRLLLYMRGTSAQQYEKLLAYSDEHPNIISMIRVIGSCDYILRVEVQDPADVSDITQSIYERFSAEIQTIKVMTLMQDLKYSTYPFDA
ncbi:MAG: Lrp/AsnC family transcriptional regulator [Bdellovibrionales bacterium]|nr:Lrp/AsnC family transcriptional regulator [Bdellovibrionales bacterium]